MFLSIFSLVCVRAVTINYISVEQYLPLHITTQCKVSSSNTVSPKSLVHLYILIMLWTSDKTSLPFCMKLKGTEAVYFLFYFHSWSRNFAATSALAISGLTKIEAIDVRPILSPDPSSFSPEIRIRFGIDRIRIWSWRRETISGSVSDLSKLPSLFSLSIFDDVFSVIKKGG